MGRPIQTDDYYSGVYQQKSKEFHNTSTDKLQQIINHYERTLRGRLAIWFLIPYSRAIYYAAKNELQRRN